MKTTCPRRIFLLLSLVALGVPSTLIAQASPVPPGGLVRWSGEGIESCSLGDREWAPRDGACWYPIDLLASGRIEVSRRRNGRSEAHLVTVADYPYDVQRIEIKDRSRVDLSPENVARSRAESARIGKLWPRETEARFELPLGPPLADLPSGGRFGARRIINGEPRSPHTGADYAADTGEPILAVAAGEVVLAEEHFFGGNSVFLDHGDGLISMYFHMSRIDVAKGDSVERGQTIGLVGATGRATGPHLHFGLRWHGARVDPGLLLGDPAEVPGID